MIFLKKNFYKIVFAFYLFTTPFFILYANNTNSDPSTPGKLDDPLGNRYADVPALIKTILEGVIKIGMPVVALAIIYCGFLFVKAQGKPEEIKKAKDALLYTLIGAAILLGSWAIAKMISATVLAL
ncbi:MAG: hypothetical protein AAB623_02065 [Patescibacteria group bacterium]